MSGAVTFAVDVKVMPKKELADPQGQTIERALPDLGFSGVSNVRVGKSISLQIDAASDADALALAGRMCEQLLANAVIETYEVDVR
jgi:phosphoribosylformylglycinamidine synthase subunit PurS